MKRTIKKRTLETVHNEKLQKEFIRIRYNCKKHSLLVWSVAILSLLFLSQPAFSDISFPKNQWHSIGPWGGDRYEVFIDPVDHLKVYVLGGAVHASADGGEHWQPLMTTSSATRGLYAYSMAINPQDPNEMYIGTLHEGAWKSSNGGEMWEPVNETLPSTDRRIRSLIVDKTDPDVLYIGIDNLSGEAQGAVYRSNDRGSTWMPFDNGLPLTEVTSIFQNPLNNELFVGTYGSGIYKYNNAEGSWIEVSNGLDPQQGLYITDIAFDPFNELVIYTCTKKDWIYKSTDGGYNWQHIEYPEPLNADYPPMAYYVRIDPNNPDWIWIGALPGSHYGNESPFYQAEPDQDIGGLFRSTDGGATWQKVMQDYGGFRLTIDPTETVGVASDMRSRVLYLTSGGINGVIKSEDGGETFQQKIEGIAGVWINGLLQHPVDNSKIFASAETGLFFSFDSGANWSLLIPSPNERVIYTWSMAVNPVDPSELYYATGEPAWAWPENKGLYRVDISTLDPTEQINHVSGEQIISTKGIGIWKVYPFGSSTIYLATQEQGILKSEDHGQSWYELNDGLGEMSVSCIVFDNDGVPLYAGTRTNTGTTAYPGPVEEGAIYKWMAESGQWNHIGISEITDAVFDIVTLPDDPNTVYVGTLNGFFVSRDGGGTWEKQDGGLPQTFAVSDIEINPDNNDIIFLSSWYNGVYVSADGSKSWKPFYQGMTHLFVQDIVINWMQTNILYAGTLGGSVFECTTGSVPSIDTLVANGAILNEPYTVQVKEMESVEITVNASDPDLEDILTYTAYYKGFKIPGPGENPYFPLIFNPETRTFQWTPNYGLAREAPYTILFVVSDGVFSIHVEVDITVQPAEVVYAPEIELSLNQSIYHQYDWMDLTVTLRNFFSPCPVDVYLILGRSDDPYLRYFHIVRGVTLPYGLDLDIPLVHFQFINYPEGSFIWTGVIVPAGADVYDDQTWLSSDQVSYSYSIY